MPRPGTPSRPLPLIYPSILGADFMRLGDEARQVMDLGADGLHIDVMDGHFVPNLTMGPDVVRGLRRELPNAFVDVHLMVREPAEFIEPFALAGASRLTFHIEATLGRKHLHERELIRRITNLGCQAGVALNPSAPAACVMHLLESVGLVLIMSVHPGFAGQAFDASVLEKTRAIRRAGPPQLRVEMDGGIHPGNAPLCVEAGCDVIVAASSIFGAADRGAAIAALRSG